ncbi:MAG TPA: GNAT family N-acetyltransferase [Bdellovibrionales bacterium]|nr:GNAT family N-acetyltransferase [Bdellovibrionales bacterium]
MNYAFRRATAEDFEFLRDLHHQTLRPYVEQVFGWDQTEQDRLFDEKFDPRELQVILADQRPAGLLQLEEWPHELFLANLLIAPELQRRGLGGKILKDLLTRAQLINKTVALTVLRPNPARRFYERHGFRVSGENEQRYFMKWTPA